MTVERVFAWAAAAAFAVVLWAGLTRPTPVPNDRLVLVGLGAVVALPLAAVYLGWLSSLRDWQRGWG